MPTVESSTATRMEMWEGTAPDPFVPVADLAKLRERGVLTVKRGGKQIALFLSEAGVFACNNRCPHEGYPLSEGTLTQGCLLTCNWHNWKFDLESGETLVGGDRLRRYPVRVVDGTVYLDLTDPPPDVRAAAALVALRDAFDRHEPDRMAREIARLTKAGRDPLEAVRGAIRWTHDRFEFGTTHAIGAAPDWLALRAKTAGNDPARALAPLVEIVGHLAWDSLRQPAYPFPTGVAEYNPEALVAAVEAEDEAAACAQIRGALADGVGFDVLQVAFARAALAHYADFGHSAIYLRKTGQLIDHLGATVAEPLLLALVRSLVYATREDLIPEFRDYGRCLAAWPSAPTPADALPRAEDFIGRGVRACLERSLIYAATPEPLYHALLGAAAWNFLHFDWGVEARNDGSVSDNVGWLDFTHAITFANAVRVLCARAPDLWPQGLLQMACFVGRNAVYTDSAQETMPWRVADAPAFFAAVEERLLDHGQGEYIVSAHLLKTAFAAKEEVSAAPDAPWRHDLLAALNRLLHTPIKRRFSLRQARQSLDFVARED